MNIQAKIALDKEKHPERYCPVKKCLWKIVHIDRETGKYVRSESCLTGYCPRHKHLAQDVPGVAIEGSF